MTDPRLGEGLEDLEGQRARLFEELAAVGDFRRGSVSVNYRRCGKPSCGCARPGHPGHGPRWLWTRTVPGRGTKGRQLVPGEVDKVRAELAAFEVFDTLSRKIVEVSEAICEARPVEPEQRVHPPAGTGPENGGSGPPT
ncbi:MAG: DUF6788 family protein [Kineosporiaceae bacterium]